MYLDKRATRAIIHLENIVHNLNCIKSLVGEKTKICAAVKADAYGHGAVEVSDTALNWGVEFLAVATVSEAVILRTNGITAPILLFSIVTDSEIPQIVDYGISPFVGDIHYVNKINSEASKKSKVVPVHIMIDTGMGRIGITPDLAPGLSEQIQGMTNIKLEGTCTHFPVSDSLIQEDIEFTRNQIHLFNKTTEAFKIRGIDPGIRHTANSGGILAYKEAHFDMVRPGICLYGYYPDGKMDRTQASFKPVMELVSRILFIKKVSKGTSISYGRTWKAPEDTYIASIPIGYGDGYNRLLSSRSKVLINNRLYPVVGRICMDQLMVNLGPKTNIQLFDAVILFGPQKEAPDAADISELTNTIPYEVTCNINKRVPRDYVLEE
jgi:alanine racemase